MDKVIYCTHVRSISGGLNIGDFIQKSVIAEVYCIAGNFGPMHILVYFV